MNNIHTTRKGFVAPEATMKKSLPSLNFINPPDWQRRRIDAWIKERDMDLLGRESDEVGQERASSQSNSNQKCLITDMVAPFDEHVAVGEIRLLSSFVTPNTKRPVYIAVLCDWEKGMKLIAPYGPYCEPASSGELLTRSAYPLRVLCLWNCISVPDEVIAKGWKTDEMSTSESGEAWAVFQYAATGRPLPSTLIERVGPPIYHPADPRCRYQQEEFRVTAPLVSQAVLFVEKKS